MEGVKKKKKKKLNLKSILCELSIRVFLRAEAQCLIVCKGTREGGCRGGKKIINTKSIVYELSFRAFLPRRTLPREKGAKKETGKKSFGME